MFNGAKELLREVDAMAARLRRLSTNFDADEFRSAVDDYALLVSRLHELIAERSGTTAHSATASQVESRK